MAQSLSKSKEYVSAREVGRLAEIHHRNAGRFAEEAGVRVRDLPGGFARRYCRADVEAALQRATKTR